MRYIKNFKEKRNINKEDYYVEISNYDYMVLSMSDSVPNMSKQSIDYISNLFNNKGDSWNLFQDSVNVSLFKTEDYDVYIGELNDEYFGVFLNKRYTGSMTYYKCDQLDGVKELLIDKGII